MQLALDGRANGHIADFDVIGLLDGEGDGFGRDGEFVPAAADLFADFGVVDGVGEFGADEARRYLPRTNTCLSW
jgi:hypothetical protein